VRLPFEPRYGLLTVAWLLGITWLSSLPDHGGAERSSLMQAAWNLAHVPLFGGLAFCVLKSLRPGEDGRARYALALVLCAACAVLDEWHQSFVPGRVSSPGDVILDLVGIVGMLLLLRAWTAAREAASPPAFPVNAVSRPGARE
jgi:VanZ family protein